MRQLIFPNWSGMQEDSGLWDYYTLANTKLKKKNKSFLWSCIFPSLGTELGCSPPPLPAKSGLLDLELLPKPPSPPHQLHWSFIVTQFLFLCKHPASKNQREGAGSRQRVWPRVCSWRCCACSGGRQNSVPCSRNSGHQLFLSCDSIDTTFKHVWCL